MVQYLVVTEESINAHRDHMDRVVEHFGSSAMAEHYLNGLIDWDGNELE